MTSLQTRFPLPNPLKAEAAQFHAFAHPQDGRTNPVICRCSSIRMKHAKVTTQRPAPMARKALLEGAVISCPSYFISLGTVRPEKSTKYADE